MCRRCWPKEDCDIQRQCTSKWTSKKWLIFGACCVTGLEVYCLVGVQATRQRQLLCYLARVRPMDLSCGDLTACIPYPAPNSGPAVTSGPCRLKNGVVRWRRPNSEILTKWPFWLNLVYDIRSISPYEPAKNYKFGIFCQQCHPSVAPDDADIKPRNASKIHTAVCF